MFLQKVPKYSIVSLTKERACPSVIAQHNITHWKIAEHHTEEKEADTMFPNKPHDDLKLSNVDTKVLKDASCDTSDEENWSCPVPLAKHEHKECDSRYANREICSYPSVKFHYIKQQLPFLKTYLEKQQCIEIKKIESLRQIYVNMENIIKFNLSRKNSIYLIKSI